MFSKTKTKFILMQSKTENQKIYKQLGIKKHKEIDF